MDAAAELPVHHPSRRRRNKSVERFCWAAAQGRRRIRPENNLEVLEHEHGTRCHSVVCNEGEHAETSANKAIFRYHETKLKQRAGLIGSPLNYNRRGDSDMNAAIVRLLPRASATLVADIDMLISTAIFCGVGLILSLSVLILDQYIPGEWF